MTSLTIRQAEPGDRGEILRLLAVTLGWEVDEQFRDFHEWKHDTGPFGPSPAWVAVDDTGLVGYRSFLLWEFERRGGDIISAARAVDAATMPHAQGRGVFRTLIDHALEELRGAGIDLVFTTPNETASRVWRRAGAMEVRRVPIAIRPRSPFAMSRLLRSRVAADRWPVAVSMGQPVATVLDDVRLGDLLGSLAATTGIRTRRTAGYLGWRYGFEPLGYRCLAVSSDIAEGLAIFRVRRRGATVETVIDDLLVPDGARRAKAHLIREVARAAPSDHLAAVGAGLARHGFVVVPGQGARLFALPLDSDLDLAACGPFDLSLGDIELL